MHTSGGRGCGKANANGSKTNHNANKNGRKNKDIKDINLEFRIGDAQQASNYLKLMEALAIHICKTYTYGGSIAHIIEYEEELDLSPDRPTLKSATQLAAEAKSEAEKLARETKLEQNKLDYKTEKDKCDKREVAYANNRMKLADLPQEKCSESMLVKLRRVQLQSAQGRSSEAGEGNQEDLYQP